MAEDLAGLHHNSGITLAQHPEGLRRPAAGEAGLDAEITYRSLAGEGHVDDLTLRRRYDRTVDRPVHDRGGWETDQPIDRTEHELGDWEMLMDAIVGTLGARGAMNVDELRRGIEEMRPDAYATASYYERWLFSVERVLTEKGVLEPGELDARVEA